FYPADTLSQAHAFYSNRTAIAGLCSLRSQSEWQVEPSFHFGAQAQGCCWTRAVCNVDDYIRLWERRIATEGVVPRQEWDSYWIWLLAEGIAGAGDREEFDQVFTRSRRSVASPRPALHLYRRWPLAEAE